jgi:hypothetical protein
MQLRSSSLLCLCFTVLAGACAGTSADKPASPDSGVDPQGEDETPPPAKDAAPAASDKAPVVAADAEPEPPTADGGDSTPTTTPDAGPISTGPGNGDYSCTLVTGIAATGQWFNAGFEKLVDGNKWELLAVHSGFIQTWADPNGSFWNQGPSSACATNAKTPDRVIMVALWLHWMHASVEDWVKVLDQVVKNWKAKDPNIKRLEFATFVRAPMDKACPASMSFKSYIEPEQDMAYEKIAAMYPGFVFAAPKWEVPSCADYGGNPPHFTSGGATSAAKQIAAYYNMKQ